MEPFNAFLPVQNDSSNVLYNQLSTSLGSFSPTLSSELVQRQPDNLMARSPKESFVNNVNNVKPNHVDQQTLFMNNTQPPISIAPCKMCGVESCFECNFCANLRMRGVKSIPATFFCANCWTQGWKEHHKIHEHLCKQYAHFIN